MKLLVLNIWGGHLRQPLLEFITRHQEVDIFCLQEVYHRATHKVSTDTRSESLNIFDDIQTHLPNHRGYFRPLVNGSFGLATFLGNRVTCHQENALLIYQNPNYSGRGPEHDRCMQSLHVSVDDQDYTIMHVHGLWNGQGKSDSQDRIRQSEIIGSFLKDLNTDTRQILCGDFNLRPDTQSMALIEQQSMINLITQYQVNSTRTRHYPKSEKFADYILVSPQIEVHQFTVLSDVVSDHAPLFMDCV